MKIINFSVSNYRSITTAHRIEFSNVTILIGKNNEGKSNLLRALEVAMLLLQRHAAPETSRFNRTVLEQSTYLWIRDFPIQLQNRRTANQTILKLEFQLDEAECIEFKKEIGVNLNGSLPLEIKIGKDQNPNIRLIKSGRGTKTLTLKLTAVAKFVAKRIYFNYIPAVRTDSETIELVSSMLSSELRILESDEKYIAALNTIAELQRPILNELAKRIQGPLQLFLPNINSVRIEISEPNRRFSLRRDIDVVVDDGTPTSLEQKGDGVKSLAALERVIDL